MDARHRIGLAQGILMGRYRLTADQAFTVIRRISNDQQQNWQPSPPKSSKTTGYQPNCPAVRSRAAGRKGTEQHHGRPRP
ncbi:ANTAR domain-containing protein [Nakamurella sp. YIM 132087]|uniref:ANTAR domain-containing protein n=1 Tax=Nakamurella alba TaxID=2665158 RepID=A0A7K1FTL2_9ACTN|nr:ANTAR domain-containing protein [Nakamurella alba]